MENNSKRNFDKEAAVWDEQPGRVKLAEDIAQTIIEQKILKPEMDILEFGCGTGLLSLRLLPEVRSITGMDSSEGMLSVFESKIARMKIKNIRTLLVDIDKGDELKGSYDLVVCSMTLHHIKDIEPLFSQFFRVIKPGGLVGIADLDLDEGQFHSDNTGVFHEGFDRAEMGRVLKKTGFEVVREVKAAEMLKPAKDGEMRSFSVFLMVGKRS